VSTDLQNLDTEAAVLAAVIDPSLSAWAVCAELGVTAQTFTSRRHASLWILACRVAAAGQEIDAFAVHEEATQTTVGQLWDALKGRPGAEDPVTGQASEWITLSWLSDLGSVRAPVATFRRNAAQLVALASQRQVRRALVAAAETLSVPVGRQDLDAAIGSVLAAAGSAIDQSTVDLGDGIGQALALHHAAAAGTSAKAGTWGIDSLDETLPLCPGRMIVVAAPPGCGKTSIMLSGALSTALASHGGAAFVSLEVGPADLATRAVAHQTGINSHLLHRGLLTTDQVATVQQVRDRLAEVDLQLRAPTSAGIDSVCGWIRAQHQRGQGRLRLVCVDYLQRITTGNPRHTENDRLTEICGKLSRLAVELNVCLLVGSQFSREGTKGIRSRSGEVETAQPEPRSSDLRGSGSIEQDANGIVGLWRKVQSDAPACEVVACVLKNREGESGGKIPLWWEKAAGRWTRHVSRQEAQAENRAGRMGAGPSDGENVF
jgi:replicative DNA helicase